MLAIRPFALTDLDALEVSEGAKTLARLYGASHPAFSAWTEDGRLVACAGIVAGDPTRPWIGHAWLIPTPLVPVYRREVYLAVRNILEAMADTLQIERLETMADADSAVEHAWLLHLGFAREGLHPKAGLDRQTKATYARFFPRDSHGT